VSESLSRQARLVLSLVARRWSLPILDALDQGTLRHHQLQTAIPGIADKVLVETLRALETYALVTRTVYAEVPLRVEYELTARARQLRELLLPLNEWTHQHADHIEAPAVVAELPLLGARRSSHV
jgi:DNA-binding HxlR family transcriptional regulator